MVLRKVMDLVPVHKFESIVFHSEFSQLCFEGYQACFLWLDQQIPMPEFHKINVNRQR